MTRRLTETYICNGCGREETDLKAVLNWLVVHTVREELRRPTEQPNRHYCTVDCLTERGGAG